TCCSAARTARRSSASSRATRWRCTASTGWWTSRAGRPRPRVYPGIRPGTGARRRHNSSTVGAGGVGQSARRECSDPHSPCSQPAVPPMPLDASELMGELPDAVVVLTEGGRIAHWSAGAQRVFGYTPAEAEGQDFAQLVVPADKADEQRLAFASVVQGRTATY